MTYKADPTKTTISILKTTRSRLNKIGSKCDNYDDIINRLIDDAEEMALKK